jgi:hypothetical protein
VWWGRRGGKKEKGEEKKKEKGEEKYDSMTGGSHLQFNFEYSKYE